MSRVKIVSPAGWDFPDQAVAAVKIARDGLRGHDRREFLKRAAGSENVFLPYLDQVKFAADEEPAHLLALGASERWGFNRNGDGFKAATCRECHPTFVKFARMYRNHKNKHDAGDLHYGRVKLSAFNEAMHRVELLVGLYKTAAAAEQYGGSQGRVADRELEKLSSNENLPVSMACKIAYDVCECCGNQARTRDEYCTGEKCAAGGCKDNLTRLYKQGNDLRQLGVDNPFPHWFDISGVHKPACRTAYGGAADWMAKAASDGAFDGGGAKLAADLEISIPRAVLLGAEPDPTLPLSVRAQVKLAQALALAAGRMRPPATAAFSAKAQPPFDLATAGLLDGNPVKVAEALGALAAETVILPLRDFARLTKQAELVSAAAAALPGVYERLLAAPDFERRLATHPYRPAEKQAAPPVRRHAATMRATYGLDKDAVRRRAVLGAVRGAVRAVGFSKSAAVRSPAADELARSYGLYKLAALAQLAGTDTDFPLTAALALSQDEVV